MADTLVQRLTGQAAAPDVLVEITLVMTDQTLLGNHLNGHEKPVHEHPVHGQPDGHDEPATVLGYGPISAAWARHLIQRPSQTTPMWIRRLFRHPTTGELAALDSTRRTFTANQRLFLRITADDTCTTPWCDAPVRHIDHITAAHHGGPTHTGNGQGLCQACNHAKQAPGWRATPTNTTPPGVDITTPTGHIYGPGAPPPAPNRVTFVQPWRPVVVDVPAHHRVA